MGVTYFKLNPETQYPGDVTVNRSLRGDEIDSNFYFLRGYDISTIGMDSETKDLILKRVDGTEIRIDVGRQLGDITLDFNQETGVLSIDTADGQHKEIGGFATIKGGLIIATDYTLDGYGNLANPLRLSKTERTGTFSAADEYRDLTDENGTLTKEIAQEESIPTGYRIVTKENISEFGRLYDLAELRAMKRALANDATNQWRIPTKKDWDDMLNFVEKDYAEANCEEVEGLDHDSRESNVYLGKVAGKLLKTRKMWENTNSETIGTDRYTFGVLPVGFIPDDHSADPDENGHVYVDSSFGKTTAFWCDDVESTNDDMFIKRFEDTKSTVYQSSYGPDNKLSIRLVKDFDATNLELCEYVPAIGMTIFTVQVGKQIWSKYNIGAMSDGYEGVYPDTWATQEETDKFDEVFIINEWNGENWVKSPLFDGNSIVIKKFNDPSLGLLRYHEFRVVLNEDGTETLEDTVGLLEEEIQEELENVGASAAQANSRCDALEEIVGDGFEDKTLTEALNEFNVSVTNEIREAVEAEHEAMLETVSAETQQRKAADTELWDAISDEISDREQAIADEHEAMLDAVSAETAAREAAVADEHDAMIAAVSAESISRIAGDAQLADDLNAESQTRQLADEQLANRISDETDARVAAVANEASMREQAVNDEHAAMLYAVSAESVSRVAGDTQITNNLNDEIQARQLGDQELSNELANEIVNREAADVAEHASMVSAVTAERTAREDRDNHLQAQILSDRISSTGGTIIVTRTSAGTDVAMNLDGTTLTTDSGGLIKTNLRLQSVPVDQNEAESVKYAYQLRYNGGNEPYGETIKIPKDLQIVEVSATSSDVAHSYQLRYKNGTVALGATIDVMKDMFIKDVRLSNMNATVTEDGIIHDGPESDPALVFSFIQTDGTYRVVPINITTFLVENEFADGLIVTNHVVKVRISIGDEGFLKVDNNGLYTSGITNAINASLTTAEGEIQALSSATDTKIAQERTARENADNNLLSAFTASANTLQTAIINEVEARVQAISAETAARVAAVANEATLREQAVNNEHQSMLLEVATEEQARMTADEAIQALIITETQLREYAVSAETAARIEAISNEHTAMIEAVSAETVAREQAVSNEHAAMLETVSAETIARQSADQQLDAAINSEATNRANADTAESQARIAGDNELNGYIEQESIARFNADSAETAARVLADSQLANSIETEALAREDADTAIASSITSLQNTLIARISELETEVARLNGVITALTGSTEFRNAVKEIMLSTLTGWPQQIELKKYDAYDVETNVAADVSKIKIKFAHDAQFIADV